MATAGLSASDIAAPLGHVLRRQANVSVLLDEVRAVDTAGLALFAVSGRSKALAFGVSPVSALLLGTLSAIGGRVASDGWSRT